jgi:hypothetical protein
MMRGLRINTAFSLRNPEIKIALSIRLRCSGMDRREMEIVMTRDLADNSGVLSEEIKALLILLLLKGGTPSDEIETALRLAGGRQVAPQAAEQKPMCPLARAAVLAMAPPVDIAQQSSPRQVAPQPVLRAKEILRNEKLAPLQCYAA